MTATPKKTGLFGRLFGSDPKRAAESAASTAGQSDPLPSERSPEAPAVNEERPPEPSPVLPLDTAVPESTPGGWFSRLKAGLSKTSTKLSEGITSILSKRKLDAATLDELEDLLIQADLGVETSARITDALAKGRYEKGLSEQAVREVLAREIAKVMEPVAKPLELDPQARPHVILTVGVNGAGKTTTIAKLAAGYVRAGKKVMLAAGDTFRAAAIDQLKVWGERAGATVIARDVGADSAGLAFEALSAARSGGYDVLLIDTAGRLQNKQGLMDELGKIIRVIKKIDDDAPHATILVLDATTGQNAVDQVQVFQRQAGVTGLVMTKLDGTARGGILVAIAAKFGLPIHAIGVGEAIEDLQPFDAVAFARAIAGNERFKRMEAE